MNGAEIITSWLTPTVLFCILNLMIGTIFIFSGRKQSKTAGEEHPPPLFRVPSLLDRVKSINLTRYRSGSNPDPIDPLQQSEDRVEEINHVTRSMSDTGEKKKDVPSVGELKKSTSEKVPADAGEAEESDAVNRRRQPAEDEAVDAKADDFINRFRQQLKLQRLDSILRYKEMLNKGIGR